MREVVEVWNRDQGKKRRGSFFKMLLGVVALLFIGGAFYGVWRFVSMRSADDQKPIEQVADTNEDEALSAEFQNLQTIRASVGVSQPMNDAQVQKEFTKLRQPDTTPTKPPALTDDEADAAFQSLQAMRQQAGE